MGGDGAHVGRRVPFEQVAGVVAHVDAVELHGHVGWVIEFNPAVEVVGRTDELVDVGGHHLVDDERLGSGFVASDVDRHACHEVAAVGGVGIDARGTDAHAGDNAVLADGGYLLMRGGPADALEGDVLRGEDHIGPEALANDDFFLFGLEAEFGAEHDVTIELEAEVVEEAPVALHPGGVAQSELQLAAVVRELHLVPVGSAVEGLGAALHGVWEKETLAARPVVVVPATGWNVVGEIVAEDAHEGLGGVAGIHHASDVLRIAEEVLIAGIVVHAAIVGLH